MNLLDFINSNFQLIAVCGLAAILLFAIFIVIMLFVKFRKIKKYIALATCDICDETTLILEKFGVDNDETLTSRIKRQVIELNEAQIIFLNEKYEARTKFSELKFQQLENSIKHEIKDSSEALAKEIIEKLTQIDNSLKILVEAIAKLVTGTIRAHLLNIHQKLNALNAANKTTKRK